MSLREYHLRPVENRYHRETLVYAAAAWLPARRRGRVPLSR